MTNFLLVTDGSISDKGVGQGGYAYRFSKVDEDGKKELIFQGGGNDVNTTNNRMELSAIIDGLMKVKEYLLVNFPGEKKDVIVISDSDLCVKILSDYIYRWLKKIKDGVLYGSTNKPVANQDLVITAGKVLFVLRELCKPHFMHINSHIPKRELEQARQKFNEKNNCLVSLELFNSIVEENELVDKMAYNNMASLRDSVRLSNNE